MFTKRIFLSAVFLLLSFLTYSQITDPNFNPIILSPASLNKIVTQPDGKILIFGNYSLHVSSKPTDHLVIRLNTDGSIDESFQSPIKDQRSVLHCIVQSDGKIVLVLNFSPTFIRLNPDGSLDDSFPVAPNNVIKGPANGNVTSICKLPNDRMLLTGSFTSFNGQPVPKIALVNIDGSLDSSFKPDVENVLSGAHILGYQSNGKILMVGRNGNQQSLIRRFNLNGTLDNSFNANALSNGFIQDIEILSDNSLILVGNFSEFDGVARKNLVKLDVNGFLDTEFFNSISSYGAYTSVTSFNEKLLITGIFDFFDGVGTPNVVRLNADGTLDPTFTSKATTDIIYDAFVLSGGDILITGNFEKYDNIERLSFAKIDSNGELVNDFVADLGVIPTMHSHYVTSTGKVFIGGLMKRINGVGTYGIALLNTNGTLDTNFSAGSGFGFGVASSITELDNNKIIVAGNFTSYNGSSAQNIIRLNSDGSRDVSFAPIVNGPCAKVFIQQDGKLIIIGSFTTVNGVARKGFARLNTDGTLDSDFNSANIITGYVYELCATNDGKFILAEVVNNTTVLKRYTALGLLDGTFESVTLNTYSGVVVKEDAFGKYYIGGEFTIVNGANKIAMTRLQNNGTIDAGFTSPFTGYATINDIALTENAILVGGSFSVSNFNTLAALNLDGSFSSDYYFRIPKDFNPEVYGLNLTNSELMLRGSFTKINGEFRSGIARLLITNNLPDAPTNLRITKNTAGEIGLAWDDNSIDEASFRIEYAIGTPTNFKVLASTVRNVTSLSYFPPSIYRGQTFYYRISARAPSGASAWSNEVNIVLKPIPVTKLSAVAESSSQNKLTWQDNTTDETHLRVQRKSPDTEFTFIENNLTPNTISYTDIATTINQQYIYRVQNVTNDGAAQTITSAAPTQNGYWSYQTDFPGAARKMAMCYASKDYIYYGGGINTGRLNDFWLFSNISKEWVRAADFPGSADFGYTAVILNDGFGERLMVIGGRRLDLTAVDEVWVFSRTNNSWFAYPPLPSGPMYGMGAYALGDQVYIYGGRVASGYSNKLWIFDRINFKWKEGASFPGAGRTYGVTFTIGLHLYFGLGNSESGDTADWWSYNLASEEWTRLGDFPGSARSFAQATPFHNKGFIAGGTIGSTILDDVWEFDANTNTWTQRTKLPIPLASAAMAASDFDIYVIGGQTSIDDVQAKILKLDPFIQPPPEPNNLVTSLVNLTNIKLNWSTTSSFEDYFIVERAFNESIAYDSIGKVERGQTTFIDTNVSERGVPYLYRIKAVNRAGEATSNPASFLITDISKKEKGLEVYPNPTHNIVLINYPEIIQSLVVVNVSGQELINKPRVVSKHVEIDLTGMPDGIYIVRINDGRDIVPLKIIKAE